MNTCVKCDKELEEDWVCCPRCGKKVLHTSVDIDSLKNELVKLYDDLDWYFRSYQKEYPKGEYCCTDYVTVSGASGGNCWGNSARPFYNNEKPNHDKIALVFKKYGIPIEKADYWLSRMGHNLEESQWEYYGNYNNMVLKVYKIDDIIETILDDMI